MSRRLRLLLVALSALGIQPGSAQVSGYLSASYGYHSNPLANYEQGADRLVQNYLELAYERASGFSTFRAGYTGGLTLFSSLSDRTYYEQGLGLTYTRAYASGDADPEDFEDPEAMEDFVDLEVIEDFMGTGNSYPDCLSAV